MVMRQPSGSRSKKKKGKRAAASADGKAEATERARFGESFLSFLSFLSFGERSTRLEPRERRVEYQGLFRGGGGVKAANENT